MNAADESVLQLFSAYINQETPSLPDSMSDEAFSAFLKKSVLHKILPMTGSVLLQAGVLTEKQTALLRSAIQRQTAGQIVRSEHFMRTYRSLLASGARPLCVKGAVCRTCYPDPDMRLSGDDDLLVSEEEYGLCREKLTELGFTADNADADAYETGFSASSGCRIELHKALFDPDSELFGDMNAYFTGVFSSAVRIDTPQTDVFAPSPDQHLLYLVLHAFKHFIGAGVGIRQICDIALFIRANEPDLRYVFDKCAEVNADVFLNAVLLIGKRCFGLDTSPIRESVPGFAEDIDIAPLLDDVMSGGIYGADGDERQHAANLTLDAVRAAKTGRKKNILRTVFPSGKTMKKKYRYLETHPYLLPAAWTERALDYIRAGNRSSEVLRTGTKREELLKKYRVIR